MKNNSAIEKKLENLQRAIKQLHDENSEGFKNIKQKFTNLEQSFEDWKSQIYTLIDNGSLNQPKIYKKKPLF